MNVWRLNPIRLMSMCPICKDVRDQGGFGARTLIRILKNNQAIEAWCVVCGGRWEIAESERAELAKRLVGGCHLRR
jgi:hypothetical protein